MLLQLMVLCPDLKYSDAVEIVRTEASSITSLSALCTSMEERIAKEEREYQETVPKQQLTPPLMPFVLQNVTYCTLQFQVLKSFIEQQYQYMETVKKTLDHMKGWVEGKMKVCEAVNDALWPAILKPNATKKNKETVIEQFEASVYDYTKKKLDPVLVPLLPKYKERDPDSFNYAAKSAFAENVYHEAKRAYDHPINFDDPVKMMKTVKEYGIRGMKEVQPVSICFLCNL